MYHQWLIIYKPTVVSHKIYLYLEVFMSALEITKQNFETEIMNSDKAALLDFWAPWCAPCRMVGPIIDEIAAEFDDIKVGKINVDNDPELAASFGAMSIPLLVVVKNGRVVEQALGAQPKASILELIEPHRG